MTSAVHDTLSSRRILTGLLGAPISHSASPAVHERAAEALGLRCHYQLIEVAGARREELKFLLEGVRRLGFAGINVTFPYKEAVLDLLDELSPSAAMIGAVNTVVVRDGRLTGYIERGVPALVEKPVTDTVVSAQRLYQAVQRSGVPVLVGHHRRHNPVIKTVREAIAGGDIGQLTAVAGLWLLKKPDDYFDVAWRREQGGGPILINLVHDIDSLRFICGEIIEVQASTSNKVRGFGVEDTAALLLKFANGAIGTVTVSDATPAPWSWELSSDENAAYPKQNQPCYLFAGTKSSLAVPTMQLWSYPSQDGWYAPLAQTELTVASFDPLVEQLRHFLDVIARSETPLISVKDAAGTLAVVEAVRVAARTGARVSPGQITEQTT